MIKGKKEENRKEHEETPFNINVLIKDQKFKINVGSGNQTIRWLTDVAIYKYEYYYGGKCGIAYGMKLENGNTCDLKEIINTILKRETNVWVLLKEEYDLYKEKLNQNF
jgi:hypothetical protein